MESQIGVDFEGPLESIWSHHPAQAGPPTERCPGPGADSF